MIRRAGALGVLAAISALGLAGCQSLFRPKPPPVVAPPVAAAPAPPAPRAVAQRRVRPAPPPRSCVPKTLPAAPGYPDTEAALRAAAGAADRYQLLAAGRILRQQRLEDLERVIAGCR
ncbi:hypothetical protein [Phenylobacterium sp.]|uniref:hypothetical protein n=1 Tax=Phenylobacterium sp. TaxID=1871053 RepID=UPI0037CA6439